MVKQDLKEDAKKADAGDEREIDENDVCAASALATPVYAPLPSLHAYAPSLRRKATTGQQFLQHQPQQHPFMPPSHPYMPMDHHAHKATATEQQQPSNQRTRRIQQPQPSACRPDIAGLYRAKAAATEKGWLDSINDALKSLYATLTCPLPCWQTHGSAPSAPQFPAARQGAFAPRPAIYSHLPACVPPAAGGSPAGTTATGPDSPPADTAQPPPPLLISGSTAPPARRRRGPPGRCGAASYEEEDGSHRGAPPPPTTMLQYLKWEGELATGEKDCKGDCQLHKCRSGGGPIPPGTMCVAKSLAFWMLPDDTDKVDPVAKVARELADEESGLRHVNSSCDAVRQHRLGDVRAGQPPQHRPRVAQVPKAGAGGRYVAALNIASYILYSHRYARKATATEQQQPPNQRTRRIQQPHGQPPSAPHPNIAGLYRTKAEKKGWLERLSCAVKDLYASLTVHQHRGRPSTAERDDRAREAESGDEGEERRQQQAEVGPGELWTGSVNLADILHVRYGRLKNPSIKSRATARKLQLIKQTLELLNLSKGVYRQLMVSCLSSLEGIHGAEWVHGDINGQNAMVVWDPVTRRLYSPWIDFEVARPTTEAEQPLTTTPPTLCHVEPMAVPPPHCDPTALRRVAKVMEAVIDQSKPSTVATAAPHSPLYGAFSRMADTYAICSLAAAILMGPHMDHPSGPSHNHAIFSPATFTGPFMDPPSGPSDTHPFCGQELPFFPGAHGSRSTSSRSLYGRHFEWVKEEDALIKEAIEMRSALSVLPFRSSYMSGFALANNRDFT
ncbi:unnamed protein product [Vitrella brassicaformis CCMP3155]|uniref:Protein kinase domain-containing protein n=1 Tax=Vitrella brassicaformis (strain CCMP3155) TaxID=1169540 RepID=A0A0G4ECA7_VITBC|nr:unnamed protein product [Vitrella brassicaformis CCMP3155]|eukprot:CEL93566.1 unnamed protein product [Vitrella brassicaformis CCMP3155]